MPAARPTALVFVAIGIVAGFFSALFGVGGGVLAVPLLIAYAGLAPRPATGTSLAAIGLTALFGVAVYGSLGDVEWDAAAKVGLPAMAGTLVGTWLQQRISSRVLVFLFGCSLVAAAVRLLLE